jgi:hypothetical protein
MSAQYDQEVAEQSQGQSLELMGSQVRLIRYIFKKGYFLINWDKYPNIN